MKINKEIMATEDKFIEYLKFDIEGFLELTKQDKILEYLLLEIRGGEQTISLDKFSNQEIIFISKIKANLVNLSDLKLYSLRKELEEENYFSSIIMVFNRRIWRLCMYIYFLGQGDILEAGKVCNSKGELLISKKDRSMKDLLSGRHEFFADRVVYVDYSDTSCEYSEDEILLGYFVSCYKCLDNKYYLQFILVTEDENGNIIKRDILLDGNDKIDFSPIVSFLGKIVPAV